jgi:hypothetical protein
MRNPVRLWSSERGSVATRRPVTLWHLMPVILLYHLAARRSLLLNRSQKRIHENLAVMTAQR